jgi:hypothetical protein
MFYFLLDALPSPATISYFWSSSKGRRAHMVTVEIIYKTSKTNETLITRSSFNGLPHTDECNKTGNVHTQGATQKFLDELY